MFDQNELQLIYSVLTQVQFKYVDSKRVNLLVDKIDALIEKPKPEDVKVEGKTNA